MQRIKYTNSFKDFVQYCNEELERYFKKKNLTEYEESRTIARYQEEMELLRIQVDNHPELEAGLWVAAFLGNLAKQKKIWISNQVVQCPFLMFLLGLASYNVLEVGFLESYYLYEKSNVSVFDYYVDKSFYLKAKEEVESFFRDSGYFIMWVGKKQQNKRIPNGFVVFPQKKSLQELGIECGKLYDDTLCIGDEFAPELWEKGTWYRLETDFISNYYFSENKTDVFKLLAASKTAGTHRPNNFYYEIMEESGLNIYTREDLYDHLMSMGLDEENAFDWTEMIRKGEFCRKVDAHEIDYGTYIELYEIWGRQILDLFSETYFLPSRWNVLEELYRCSKWKNEKKIIAVDFDGTLSLGEWPDNGPANTQLIEFLKERKKSGDKIILWTCREGNALQEAVKWCEREGLVFDAVNDNVPEMIELYGTNSRKVSCDYYIDDRAVWMNAFGLLR